MMVRSRSYHLTRIIWLTYLQDLSECQHWTPWRNALHVGSKTVGYAVEYVFFIMYSVSTFMTLDFWFS